MEKEPSDSTVLLSATGWIGVFLIFVLILGVTYLNRPDNSQSAADTEAREAIRADVEAEQNRLVTTCEWVNRPEGIVRIPVDVAMEVVVKELRKEQEATAN
jgi:hypothetical protein